MRQICQIIIAPLAYWEQCAAMKSPKTRPVGPGTRNITFNLPNTLYVDLVVLASESGLSYAAYLRALIEHARDHRLIALDDPEDKLRWAEAIRGGERTPPRVRKVLKSKIASSRDQRHSEAHTLAPTRHVGGDGSQEARKQAPAEFQKFLTDLQAAFPSNAVPKCGPGAAAERDESEQIKSEDLTEAFRSLLSRYTALPTNNDAVVQSTDSLPNQAADSQPESTTSTP